MQNYNFNSLILIVGTNPLPNFVTADYFLKNNKELKNIYLLYSEETKEQRSTKKYAENLKELLKKRYDKDHINFYLIPLSNVGFAEAIREDTQKRLVSKIQRNSSVHLDYTGGTKAMGVHIYRTIEDNQKNVFSKASFSYLDARSFRLIDDNKGVISGDLRKEIQITFEELVKLHGYEIKREDSSREFEDSLQIFEDLINKNELDRYFKVYKREDFCKKDSPDRLIEKKKDLTNSKLKEMIACEPLLSVVLSLPEEYRIFNPDGTFREPATDKALKKTIKFLDGQWLEQYVYKLIEKDDTLKNLNVEINCEISSPDWGPNQRFEIDISLINGYQLIGISCTTSDVRSLCKSKGFEILHRTRQIGGEEARAVLITRLESGICDLLQKELELDTGSSKENILVLGKEDLKRETLIEKLKEFIE